ncbi:Uncharacterized protein PCOAH_00051480 [Plasmodium coatneyi]|uniref:Uncharacterized protein n=1 Tax=Plasmodium coatneyi TaxID=208452 RepID=A0A1B1E751_9APIC|nr:Uncharacterized protein PCOAH_00051480 [Plasmodium coatneyi]ANQ10856.1 Uncharacterized protein PCOAH_00051480 [Plasmodium coatneyi]
MKRDRNQHVGEGKGKKKKNDHNDEVDVVGPAGAGKEAAAGGGKGGTQKSGKDIEMFNPQLSARELKKIQYYENMFKKMEQKREEQQNEGDNKGKRKVSNSRKMKGETEPSVKGKEEESSGTALEVTGEAVVTEEKGDDAKQNGVEETARGKNQKGGKNAKEAKQKSKNANPKEEPTETCAYAVDTEKQNEPHSMDDNQRGKNNKWRKGETSQVRIKKEELRVDKGICSKMGEGSNKAATLKGKKCVENSNRFASDSDGGGEEENDELHRSERDPPRGDKYNDQGFASPKNYTYRKNGMAEGGKGDREHESDNDVNYDNDPNERINFKGRRKIYPGSEREKKVLKIKRSFSVSSNISEYFFDTSSIQLVSDNEVSVYGKEEQSSEKDNENEPTFSYKKKKLLQLLTCRDCKDDDSVHPLAVANNGSSSNNTDGVNYNLADSEKWLIWKNKKNYNIRFASNNNIRKRKKWHIVRSYHLSSIETDQRVDLHPNGEENFVDEQMSMNGRSNGTLNGTEYFPNGEDVPIGKKSFCEKKFNGKTAENSSTTNMIINANDKFDVNCCIKKYLDNMRYTNLKKLKKVNKSNLKLYVKGCTNFLNFDKVDSAILSMRKFQEALQRKGGVGGDTEGDAAPL